MQRVAIVMSATANLAFAVANVVRSVSVHSPNFAAEFIIYHEGMDEEDMRCLRMFGPCRFIPYVLPSTFDSVADTSNVAKYSHMAFALYEMFDHLDDFENVIYLDCDLLIQRDISGLISYGPVAMAGGRLTIREACGQPDLQIDADLKARSTGVVVINRDLPEPEKLKLLAYDYTARFWDTLVFPDQGVLNLVLALEGIPVTALPAKYNKGKAQRNLHEATIVHTQGGKSKFWNNGVTSLMFPEWNRYYQEWLKVGGKPYSGPRYYWEYAGVSQTELFQILKMAREKGLIPSTNGSGV